jgi:hypothetical protein
MLEPLVCRNTIGTAQGIEQGLHRTAMVTAGGVDHRVGGAGLIGQ